MANYTITNEGTPIIPYELNVVIDVNHSVSETSTWVTATPYPSQAFSDAVDAHTANWENVAKTTHSFTTEDTNRDGSWSVSVIGPNSEDPAKTDYSLTTTCTIVGAIAEVPQSTQSDKTGVELEAELQAAADAKELEYFTNRPGWTPLP
jgi:hypothetical protein